MNDRRAVLAYSGGLDTSAIVVWLRQQGFEVHAVLVDVGQDEDLPALCKRALLYGAASAVVRDAKPGMLTSVVPYAIALGATYEGDYRLGTALARPFIAEAQVRRARELGGATLVHGATGKGNDQIRFEFAYRSLAPDLPVLAPWKTWGLTGREDLVALLKAHGFDEAFDAVKVYSMDENLWHLSVEGGALEDPTAMVNIDEVLAAVSDRFATSAVEPLPPDQVEIAFERGVPVALNREPMALGALIDRLNGNYRHAPWAWDLVLENRFTGIKSRGLYINPAARLLHMGVGALARCVYNKPSYDRYVSLGHEYGSLLYRGEYYSDQRVIADAAADAVMARLTGTVTITLAPTPYVARMEASQAMFRQDLATFEASDFSHAHAEGFIRLTWLGCIGRPYTESTHGHLVETIERDASELPGIQRLPERGLVSSSP